MKTVIWHNIGPMSPKKNVTHVKAGGTDFRPIGSDSVRLHPNGYYQVLLRKANYSDRQMSADTWVSADSGIESNFGQDRSLPGDITRGMDWAPAINTI